MTLLVPAPVRYAALQNPEANALDQHALRPLASPEQSATQEASSAAAASLAEQFEWPLLDSVALALHSPRFDLWTIGRAQTHLAVLLQPSGEPYLLTAALTDPFDRELLIQLEHAAGNAVRHALCTPDDLRAFLSRSEKSLRAMDGLTSQRVPETEPVQSLEVLSLANATHGSSAAVRLVNSTLYDALRAGASDVHLEATAQGLSVRYRIDGVLDDVADVYDAALSRQAISRLKVLAELDIAEQRIPQDGSFQVQAEGRVIDLRLSIMPSVYGEDAVIRILDKQAMVQTQGKLSLEGLGFDAVALTTLRRLTSAPYGLVLVTGPTGAGKTTTLYAALTEVQSRRDKVITIEDPVEYHLPGVLQIPVNEKKGLSFARGLRSILRHDPDKIMVGEIRDRDTAEIAVQSALTGHLVLTTVHANHVFDVFGRFTHLGLDPYNLVSALNGVWAQRLVRVNCLRCRQAIPAVAPEDFPQSALDSDHQASFWVHANFMSGVGCSDCRGTGYRGRRAIAEFLVLDDDLRELIIQRVPVRRIKEVARQRGMPTLLDAALALVREGITTWEEVRRVALAP